MENLTECQDCTKEFEPQNDETLCKECKESIEENQKFIKYMRE